MEEVNHPGTSVSDVAARLAEKWNQAEATEKPAPIVEQEEIPAEATDESVDDAEGEADTEEVEADTEQTTDEPEQAAAETSFQTIYELAEALELDPDEFLGSIKAKVKVNGKESEVSLSEALKGYQLEADYRRKTAETAEERREIERQREQIVEQSQLMQQKLADADATATIAINALMSEYNSLDWNGLKENDPTQFVIRQQEYQSRMGQLQQAKQAIAQQAAETQQKHLSEIVPRETAAMKRAIPEWEDDDTRKAEQVKVFEYLTKTGYKAEELDKLYDHRAVVIARKAMLYDMATSKPQSEKKVITKVTKSIKPQARKPATTIKQEAIQKAKSRLKKSGKPADAASLLLQRI